MDHFPRTSHVCGSLVIFGNYSVNLAVGGGEIRTVYSETCIRRSPLGPDQLALIQMWPAYRVCIEIS